MATETRDGTDNLWEAMTTQRAIRLFRPDPVPDELVWKILDAAIRAPNGTNRQQWAFVAVRDPALRQQIAAHVARTIGQDPAFSARVDGGMRSDDRSTRLMMTGARRLADHLDDAQVFILPCMIGPHPVEMDRLLFGSSIYLAAQNIMLAARGLGLGTVMTIFHARMIDQLREWLSIPPEVTPVALIPLGWPQANFGPVTRQPVETVAHWDRWGNTLERA
jgi:nitroreductase